jgi:hypothetical protein
VDLVLSGHDHIYERGDAGALKYIISGGGGAPLYRIAQPVATTRKAEPSYHFVEIATAADSLRVVAHRLDGSILEACGLPKGRPWDCDPFPWQPIASKPTGASAPAVAPAAAAPPSVAGGAGVTSRCGCELPGRAGSLPLHGLLAGALALACLRRLRRG